jgi:hypothetical protein
MDFVADFASRPLFLVHIDRNLRIAPLGVSAAAAGYAIGEVAAMLGDIQSAAIGTNDALSMGTHICSVWLGWQRIETRFGPLARAKSGPAGSWASFITTHPGSSESASESVSKNTFKSVSEGATGVPPSRKAQGMRSPRSGLMCERAALRDLAANCFRRVSKRRDF